MFFLQETIRNWLLKLKVLDDEYYINNDVDGLQELHNMTNDEKNKDD